MPLKPLQAAKLQTELQSGNAGHLTEQITMYRERTSSLKQLNNKLLIVLESNSEFLKGILQRKERWRKENGKSKQTSNKKILQRIKETKPQFASTTVIRSNYSKRK